MPLAAYRTSRQSGKTACTTISYFRASLRLDGKTSSIVADRSDEVDVSLSCVTGTNWIAQKGVNTIDILGGLRELIEVSESALCNILVEAACIK